MDSSFLSETHIQQFDAEGEEYGEIDVPFGYVNTQFFRHTFEYQCHPDENQERQRQDLQRWVFIDKMADRACKNHHDNHG